MALLRKLASNKIEDDEINSIIENINNILTTRRDYGFFFAGFWDVRSPSSQLL
jgi:hypothetical protein